MGFNPDEYLKQGSKSSFNPDAYLSEEMPANKPQKTINESAARGALQGATAGFSDEASGAIDAASENTFLEKLPEVAKVGLAMGFPLALITENAKQLITGEKTWDDLKASYISGRESSRAENAKAQQDNPITYGASNLYGAILSPANKIVGGLSAAKQGFALGGLYGMGTSDAEDIPEIAADTVKGAAIGATLGKTLDVAAPYIAKGANKIGNSFTNKAEQLAENATGATRVQAEKFKDGTGRFLLDKKIVQFGDDAEKIAERAGSEIGQAEKNIDGALKAFDKKGVQIQTQSIIDDLTAQANSLKKDPSQADIVRKIESIVDDIKATGSDYVSPSMAEKIKRGFNRGAKNWLNPEQGQASKVAYRAYRDAVEDAAKNADSEIYSQFFEGKKTFGTLAPVVDAAEKRALQLNQSPLGGFADAVTAGVSTAGGPATTVGIPVARRLLSPRLSSSAAVALDKTGKALKNISPSPAPAAQQTARVVSIDSTRPQLKGVEKWLFDGIEKVASIDPTIDKQFLQSYKSTKKRQRRNDSR